MVWEVKREDDLDGTSMALKMCTKFRDVPADAAIGSMLNHPHCLPVLDHFPYEGQVNNKHMKTYGIVMPLCQGDLGVMSNIPELTVSETLRLLLQISSALAYMHSENIVHRDIKPWNVMLCQNTYMLGDYGQSLKLIRDDYKLNDMNAGSRLFWAPEIDRIVPYFPKPTDVWALGVSIWHLVFGTYPYTIANVMVKAPRADVVCMRNYVKDETKGDLTFPALPAVPDDLKRILRGMLEKNPLERMTAEQIANDRWLRKTVQNWERVVNVVLAS